LRATQELFELGIHPNFLPHSSHGSTVSEVLANCMSLVPEARCIRMHSLMQSSPLLGQIVRETPIEVDVSLLLPRHTGLQPVRMPFAERSLLRLPFCWEDDIEMMFTAADWEPVRRGGQASGLRILNFHPIHIYLNSSTMATYQALKAAVPSLASTTGDELAPFREPGRGVGWAFRQVLDRLAASGEASTIRRLADRWNALEELCA
jgi:hypothetical protein